MANEGSYWTDWARRRLRRRGLLAGAAGGLGLAGLGLAGCSTTSKSSSSAATPATGAQSGAAQKGGTYNDSTLRNNPLDPQKVSAGAQTVIGGVYSRLFKFQTSTDPTTIADHNVENDLGLSAESPDAITWTVKLRPDAKYQNIAPVNGHAVEAEDVKASWTRALDPATTNPNRGQLNMVDAAQIQTPDKQTVVFKLAYPYAPFKQTLASPAYSWVLPREAAAGAFDPVKTAIGSGPFILDTVTPDVAYTYKRNPDYFLKDQPQIDGYKTAVIPTVAAQMAQFTAGNLDLMQVDNPNDLATMQQQNPKVKPIQIMDGRPFPIYFQLGDSTSIFQDPRVRQAVSMALDRDALGKAIYSGQSVSPTFIPGYMGKWALKLSDLSSSTAAFYKYDPANAKKLLEAAGVGNVHLQFAYVQIFGVGYTKLCEACGSMLNAVGLQTTLVSQDYNKDFVDSGKGTRQGYFPKDMIVFASSAGYTEADEFIYSYFDSQSTSNQEHLNDPQMDAMISKQRTIVDVNERLKAVLDIQKYVCDKVYVVPTVGSYYWDFVNPRIQNFQYSSTLGSPTEEIAKLWIKA
jgi:peptide/nickel transport system substrate-binding protein